MFSEKRTAELVFEAMRTNEDLKPLNAEEMRWAAGDLVRIHIS